MNFLRYCSARIPTRLLAPFAKGTVCDRLVRTCFALSVLCLGCNSGNGDRSHAIPKTAPSTTKNISADKPSVKPAQKTQEKVRVPYLLGADEDEARQLLRIRQLSGAAGRMYVPAD